MARLTRLPPLTSDVYFSDLDRESSPGASSPDGASDKEGDEGMEGITEHQVIEVTLSTKLKNCKTISYFLLENFG